MERYKLAAPIRKRNDGKRLYSSLRHPKIPLKSSDVYFYAKRFMRLDLLAHAYYGDVTLWPIIARANNLGKGSLLIKPGLRIRVPYPVRESEFTQAYLNINEID